LNIELKEFERVISFSKNYNGAYFLQDKQSFPRAVSPKLQSSGGLRLLLSIHHNFKNYDER